MTDQPTPEARVAVNESSYVSVLIERYASAAMQDPEECPAIRGQLLEARAREWAAIRADERARLNRIGITPMTNLPEVEAAREACMVAHWRDVPFGEGRSIRPELDAFERAIRKEHEHGD
jgi:hypothetical protein